VAKKRSISFLLNSSPFSSSSTTTESRPKIKPKLKAEIKLKTTCDEEDEAWSQRSEPVFTPADSASTGVWAEKSTGGAERERPRTIDAAQRLGTKKRPSVGSSSKSPVAKQRSNSTENKVKKAVVIETKIMPRTARKQMQTSSTTEKQLKRHSPEFCGPVEGNFVNFVVLKNV